MGTKINNEFRIVCICEEFFVHFIHDYINMILSLISKKYLFLDFLLRNVNKIIKNLNWIS